MEDERAHPLFRDEELSGMHPEVFKSFVSFAVRDDEVKQRLRAETKELFGSDAVMLTSADQGQVLEFLVELTGARKTLELGVFTGYSSLCTALALPADGKILAVDVSEKYTSLARKYWEEAGVAHKIELRLTPALDVLRELGNDEANHGAFDFVFIDAVKTQQLEYINLLYPLLRQGGMIAIDNVIWKGRLADPAVKDDDTEAIRKMNAAMHDDQRFGMCVLANGDGMLLLRKR